MIPRTSLIPKTSLIGGGWAGRVVRARLRVDAVPTVLLVRHGRTTANASGTLAGWTPGIGLDDVGRAQAQTLAGRLAAVPLAAVVTSPLQRCREIGRASCRERG